MAPALPFRLLPARRSSWRVGVLLGVVAAGACQATTATQDAASPRTTALARSIDEPSPALTAPAPTAIPSGAEASDEAVVAADDLLVVAERDAPGAPEADRVALSGDLRQGWVLVDALRVATDERVAVLTRALETLTGQALPADEPAWMFYSDLLLSWDVPAPPGYLQHKAALYAAVDGSLLGFFDSGADLDWRTVTWSGAPSDAGPALDAPEIVDAAASGEWLGDDDVVYGLLVGGEARAYPRRVLAVHEVVNDTLGGRPIAVSYCRTCSAVVAFDRSVDASGAMLRADGTPLDLATTGLLERGAPLLYDRGSGSLVRAIVGEAVSGQLGLDNRTLDPIGSRTTTWGAWRAAFPDSTVISDDAGVGRVYLAESTGGSTDAAPWPVGSIDPRLTPGRVVLGVSRAGSAPVAFVSDAADEALRSGAIVEHAGVRVVLDGGGLTAVDAVDGKPLAAHEANWMTWSGFHPTTDVWAG